MPDQNRRDIDEWRLGLEPGEAHPAPPPVPAPAPLKPADLSAARLETPLYVLTVEHLGWAIIALYGVLARLGGLGLRPLSSVEAIDALFARDIASRGLSVLSLNPPASGWLDPLRAGVFLAFGSGDFGARIIAAVFGLLLIGAAFMMRRQLGRAGALAFAAMLTLSPTLTWFSRSTSATIPAVALVVVAIAMVFALVGASDTLKVAILAIAIALGLSADPMAFPIAAMFVVILILMALWELIIRRNHPMIRLRVWWERRSAHLIFCAAIAIGLYVVFASGFGRRNFVLPVAYGAMQQWLPVLHPAVREGLNFYLPAVAFYEFAIAIFGALGLLAFLAFQLRSRLAAVTFLWTIFSVGFFLANPIHRQDWLVMMIVPAALMGAALIDRIHHGDLWLIIRYPIAVLALLTIYVQLATNFVHFAPDPSEASWAHHMLLYWTEPATTMVAEEEFSHAERAISDRATVFLADPNPVERWYLREMKPADVAVNADLLVSPATAEKPANLLESSEFTLDEKWSPSVVGLNGSAALRYFFTQHAWSEVADSGIRVDVRGPTPPTPVPAPSASPSPSESPAAAAAISPSSTTTPTASPSPTAPSPGETPAAAATSIATAARTPTASMEAAPAEAPVASPANSPVSSPTASDDSPSPDDSGDSGASEAPTTAP